MREELGMIGVRGSYDMKLPLPLSSLKSLPLAPPQCLQTVRDQLAKCPPPSVGLQVPFQKSFKGYSCFSNMGKQCIQGNNTLSFKKLSLFSAQLNFPFQVKVRGTKKTAKKVKKGKARAKKASFRRGTKKGNSDAEVASGVGVAQVGKHGNTIDCSNSVC